MGLLLLAIVQAADVISESLPIDPNDPFIELCSPPNESGYSVNANNCPTANTGQELLCRLFSIIPLANNPNNLATSTTLLDPTMFDIFGSEAGNYNGIITVTDNGCKMDQCRHADGTRTSLTFSYDHQGVADWWNGLQTPFSITATCYCNESKGETANVIPVDTTDPFECICDAYQENFYNV